MSAIWRPMVSDGLSDVIGFWKIMAIRLPRIRRIASSGTSSSGVPAKPTLPATMRPPDGKSRMTALAVIVLPDPDSPTMPTTVPRRTVKPTLSTARRGGSRRRWISTVRSATSSSTSPGMRPWSVRASGPARSLAESIITSHGSNVRIEHAAETVADEVERQRDDDNEDARHEDDMRSGSDRPFARVDHVAPVGRRWAGAEPEKAQACGHEDHEPNQYGGVNDKRADHVREQFVADHLTGSRTSRARGFYKI